MQLTVRRNSKSRKCSGMRDNIYLDRACVADARIYFQERLPNLSPSQALFMTGRRIKKL